MLYTCLNKAVRGSSCVPGCVFAACSHSVGGAGGGLVGANKPGGCRKVLGMAGRGAGVRLPRARPEEACVLEDGVQGFAGGPTRGGALGTHALEDEAPGVLGGTDDKSMASYGHRYSEWAVTVQNARSSAAENAIGVKQFAHESYW